MAMDSIRAAMHALSAQLMAMAEPALLKVSVRNVMLASVMATSVAPAMAQQDPNLLPERSAARWGEVLGGSVLGEVVRGAVGTTVGPVERVLVGIATEVGRNGGRRIAQSPYDGQQNNGQYRPMLVQQADQLDTLALRTVFAYEQAVQTLAQFQQSAYRQGVTQLNSQTTRSIMASFDAQRRQFDAAYRSAQSARQDVRPWESMQRALNSPAGTVSMSMLSELGSPMMARLQRPGGPGYNAQPQMETLDSLRQQMGMHQQQRYFAAQSATP